MLLRFVEDQRTLIWAFVLFPMVPLVGFANPALAPWLVPVSLYLSYCSGVLTHNHVHSPVFRARALNDAYSAWLSFFYGCPTFTWLPTHTVNHHRYVNGPGDLTQTTRHSPKNTLLGALTYPFRSAAWQARAIFAFVASQRAKRSARLRQIALQSLVVLVGHPLVAAASFFHAGSTGLVVYAALVGFPALFAPWSMMFTNYLQHVDCDPSSADDHSRNFVDPVWNFFVFDAGYHTVHHEHPARHWSEYAELHEARKDRVRPDLNQATPLAYCLSTYLVAPLAGALGVTARGRRT